jgi:L-ascorbate metabolism protein UlaG (beta-lactamase superfamily)
MQTSAKAPGGARQAITVRLVGGPTALIGIGGLWLLTDPAFDAHGLITGGSRSPAKAGSRSPAKAGGQGRAAGELGAIHAVLLSHDQHVRNLDPARRRRLATGPMTLTSTETAGRLSGNATALPPWYHLTLDRPDGGCVKITGTPARHGPDMAQDTTSRVTGFVLTGPDVPTIYVSGDNASLAVVEQIAERFAPVDLALLSAGGARTRCPDGYLTLTSDLAARAARILSARTVIPLHTEGCAHITEGPGALHEAFASHGLADQLTQLAPGEQATV